MKLDRKAIDCILWVFIALVLGLLVIMLLVPSPFFQWALGCIFLLMLVFILIFDRCPHCHKCMGGRFRSGQFCPHCGKQL